MVVGAQPVDCAGRAAILAVFAMTTPASKMLRPRAIATALALCAIVAALTPAARADAAKEKEKTPLGRHMSAMGKNLRVLKRQVADPAKNASSIELVSAMKKEAAESKKLVPEKAEEIPAGEREKWLADYREQITELENTFGQIEKALRADRNDEAKTLVEKLGSMRREGHEKFNAEDDAK